MVLSNPFPGHDALATFADLRRDLEGAVVRDAAGVMRAGVFPAHFNPLVTGRSDMRVNILDFRAVQNRGGAVFIANAGTDTSVMLDASPGANKRIDLIYVTMQSATLGDAASLPLFGVVKGTASPSPTVPALPPNVADAIRLATVEIPAGATTTLSAGVVITQVYPYTSMAGGTVVVRNLVELGAWIPAPGSRAFCIADNGSYARGPAAWDDVSGATTYPISLTIGSAAAGFVGPSVTVGGGIATVVGRIDNGSGLTLSPSFQQVATLPTQARPSGSIIAPATNAGAPSGVVYVQASGAFSVAGSTASTFAFSYPVG